MYCTASFCHTDRSISINSYWIPQFDIYIFQNVVLKLRLLLVDNTTVQRRTCTIACGEEEIIVMNECVQWTTDLIWYDLPGLTLLCVWAYIPLRLLIGLGVESIKSKVSLIYNAITIRYDAIPWMKTKTEDEWWTACRDFIVIFLPFNAELMSSIDACIRTAIRQCEKKSNNFVSSSILHHTLPHRMYWPERNGTQSGSCVWIFVWN